MDNRFEIFTALIAKIARNVKKIKNQEMAEYELKSAPACCLYYLYTNETLTATELCVKCEEDKATISRAIEGLEEKGYIFCDSKHTKRYKSALYLTEKGKKVGKEIADKVNNVLDEVSVGLSERERVEFYRCLMIISDNLESIGKHIKVD